MELISLNDDCLLEIFKYLNKEDLVSISKIIYNGPRWNAEKKNSKKPEAIG